MVQVQAANEFPERSIVPIDDLAAYEVLWSREQMTVKRCADLFRSNSDALPSDLVEPEKREEMTRWLLGHYKENGVKRLGIRVHRAGEYPGKLREARNPVEVLTYQGFWNWTESPSVSVVGTRNPTDEGIKRTRKLVKLLADGGYTVVSGLARGIDTAAHRAALEIGCPTLAVIGTPLSHCYPKENRQLQDELAERYCVISQVPAYLYSRQDYRRNRAFFPERNATMSALTLATIIVEAGETSGTLIQARAALYQGRKLFVLDSCFQNEALTWPHSLQKKGAIRLKDFDQLRDALAEVRPETLRAV